jgi:16S rRNA (uracil1498-N3)-methyltransferase
MPRFFVALDLQPGQVLDLPAGAARHVQVLRMQPGQEVTLFNSWVSSADGSAGPTPYPQTGGEFTATVLRMGKSQVQVQVGAHAAVQRENARAVHLAVGMPANERMDWLVEKATELGVARITPLITERTVLRLPPDRAAKKQAHWQSIAVAACEQCGRNRVPLVMPVMTLVQWLLTHASTRPLPTGYMLSLRGNSQPLGGLLTPQPTANPTPQKIAQGASTNEVTLLSGPEGGLTEPEERTAGRAGFEPVSLGPRVLRAETAALAALTLLGTF